MFATVFAQLIYRQDSHVTEVLQRTSSFTRDLRLFCLAQNLHSLREYKLNFSVLDYDQALQMG